MEKKEKMTKTKAVLLYLQNYGKIDSLKAIELFKATRLSAIIFNLKKKYNIATELNEGVDCFGNKNYYATYVYLGEKYSNANERI